MASRQVARRAALRRTLGLPAASLGTMTGIVLATNAHLYGWPGAAGGVLLVAASVALAVRCFRKT